MTESTTENAQKTVRIPLKFVKRDGTPDDFNPAKIRNGMVKAFAEGNTKLDRDSADELVDTAMTSISELGKKTVKADEISKIVSRLLMERNPDAADAYITYREERTRVRTLESDLLKQLKDISESDLKSCNTLRDNANESGATPAGMYGKIGGAANKTYNLLSKIARRFAKQHKEGYMHIHDLNMYNLTFNCLNAPVKKLLLSGFDAGGMGFLRPARSIQSATALTAVILQLQSNQQYGGIAVDNFDFEMAPFVNISFLKNLAKELNRYYKTTHDPKFAEFDGRFKLVRKKLVAILEEQKVTMDMPTALLYRQFPADCVDEAIDQTDDDTHQAMEALVQNLNSLQSRSGNQVPFSSLNFGLDVSACGRMVSHNLIRAQYEGMGDGLTAIFPILIFKMMEGYTVNDDDPNVDLFDESIKCLARRFYPNFVSEDNEFNHQYIKYDTCEVNVPFEFTVKCRGLDQIAVLKAVDTEFDKIQYEYRHEDKYWEIVAIKDGKVQLRRLRPETTVSAMGCRTRVIGNINGPEQTTGRGNFAFHTINLPRLAIEAHIAESDIEKRKALFFSKLDGMLADARDSLLDRFNLICKRTYEAFPFTMQQGIYLTSDDKPHKVTDTIAEVLKQSTLSIGYIGIAETVTLLTGKTFGVDHEVDEFAQSIVRHMREFTDKCQVDTHLNWSTFATPAEAVAGRFATIDKKKFAIEKTSADGVYSLTARNKKLADVDLYRLFGKGYYTNSHMMDFSLDTTLENKIKVEAPFHKLSNAGHIFYYKLDGDPSDNLPAVKAAIMAMYRGNLGYYTITFSSCDCLKCGYHGIIKNACPKCGCADEDYIVRMLRVTGYLSGSPKKSITKSCCDGKLAEFADRHNI